MLEAAWTTGFTTRSHIAREAAEVVAMAASLQFITTRVNRDVYSREWQITTRGLSWLNEHKDTR